MSTSVLKALPGKLDIKRHSPSILFISASLAMSTSVLKALPGKLDIKRHSPSILYLYTDETYVHSSHVAFKCWQDSSVGIKIPFSKSEWFKLYDYYTCFFVEKININFVPSRSVVRLSVHPSVYPYVSFLLICIFS